MAAPTIVETKNGDSIIFGIGNLALAEIPYTSPLNSALEDTGILSQAELTYNRVLESFKAGGVTWKTVIREDTLTLTATYAEVAIKNLNRHIQGTAVGSPANTIKFGGGRTLKYYYTRFEHTRTDGVIITADIFKAGPSGELKLTFGDQFATYPTTFEAIADGSKSAGERYGLIKIA